MESKRVRHETEQLSTHTCVCSNSNVCGCVCIKIVMVTVQNWHKNRHIDQWNRQESQEMNIHLHWQLIYDKGGKKCTMGKKQPLQ